MQSKNRISLLRKTLYGIMLLGILLLPLGAGITPVAHAQDETPEAPTPTSEPPACFALNLIVAAGEGGVAAATPHNCDGGYLAGTNVLLTVTPSQEFVLQSWNGTNDDSSIELTNSVDINGNISVSVSFVPSNLPTGTSEGGSDGDLSAMSFGALQAISEENAATYPRSANVLLDINFEEGQGYCSGVLVDSMYVLTAAHCLYEFGYKDSNGDIHIVNDYVKDITVMPGYSGINMPFGADTVKKSDNHWYVFPEYVNNPPADPEKGDSEWDIGIIKLARPMGISALAGSYKVGYNNDDNFFRNTIFHQFGFPHDPSANAQCDGFTMCYWSGNWNGVWPNSVSTDVLSNAGQTYHRASGSGAYAMVGGERIVYAVASTARSESPFSFVKQTRITATKYNTLQNFITAFRPDTPDLIPLAVHASPDTITAGSPLSSVDFIVYNNSLASWNDAITAEVYLSSDSDITPEDTHLGSVITTAAISPNGYVTVNLQLGLASIPANAGGTMYVGIRLEVTDADTTNNTTIDWDVADIEITPTTSCLVPGIPHLVYPTGGMWTANLRTPLDWDPTTNTNEYRVLIDDNPDFSSPHDNVMVPSGNTQFTTPTNLSDTTWYWQVTGHYTANGCNVWGTPAEGWFRVDTTAPYFSTSYNTSNPTPGTYEMGQSIDDGFSGVLDDSTFPRFYYRFNNSTVNTSNYDGRIDGALNSGYYKASITIDSGRVGQTIYWRIQAWDNAGNEAWSTVHNGGVIQSSAPTKPPAPTNLNATSISASEIDLGWSDQSSDESGFKIERSLDGSSAWVEVGSVGANVQSFQNTADLNPCTLYYYRVRAYRSGDNAYSDYSGVNGAATKGCTGTANIHINELDLDGEASVELYNPKAQAVDISDWHILFEDSSGAAGQMYAIPSDVSLNSGAYITIHAGVGTNSSTNLYTGTVTNWSSSYTGGWAALLTTETALGAIDFVRWGDSAWSSPDGMPWTGANPAKPGSGQSLARDASSTDSDDGGDWCIQNQSLGSQNIGCSPAAFGKSSPTTDVTNQPINLTLSWQATTPLTKYQYCYDTTNDGACTGWTDNGNNTSVLLSNLSYSTNYYWHVRAYNGAAGPIYSNSLNTAFWTFRTQNAPTQPPSAFNKGSPINSTTPLQPLNVSLAWASTSPLTEYQYCYDITNDNACSNWTPNGTSTSVILPNLQYSTTYYWHVRAYSGATEPTYSNGADTAFWKFKTENPPADVVVTNVNNAGPGSLRQAIIDATTGKTITFDSTLSGQKIILSSTLTIDKNLIIDGFNLNSNVIISGDTNNDGTGDISVFNIPTGVTVSLSGLTITKGWDSGIENSGNLSIMYSTLVDNSANTYGGAIVNSGSLSIENSMISENTARLGGGIMSWDDATVQITNTTFFGNSSSSQGGAIFNRGTLSVVNSTFVDNHADQKGGAIIGINNMEVTNSTFFGNSSNIGGAIFNASALTLTNSTLSNNSANIGGGIFIEPGIPVNIANTIIANSISGEDCGTDVGGPTIVKNINNLIEDGSCFATFSGNPHLESLSDNGGSTETLALMYGSPAIDAGDDGTCTANPVSNLDQRGIIRPQGTHCDIGAYEYVDIISPIVISITRLNSNPTSAPSVNFIVTFSESVTGVDKTDFVALTTGLTGASVTGVSGSGKTYTVIVNTGAGIGTIRLDVPITVTIIDLAGNPLGSLPYTSSETYTVNKPPPATILTAPIGNIAIEYNPNYQWNKVNSATRYHLYVSGPGGEVIDQWYEADSICDATTCTVTPGPSATLTGGTYSWYVQTRNSVGDGPWSNNAQPTNFSVTAPSAPGAATLTYPAQGQNIGTDFTPTYTWNKVNDATYYHVYVGGSGGAMLDQWYQASAVCGASICSINPSSTLGVGSYNWFIQTYGAGGYGPWSNNTQPTNFSTSATSAPAAAALTYPAQGQNIGTNYTPTYTWNKVNTATWYHVYVGGPSGAVLDQWVQASVVCGDSTCSFTPTNTLSGGTYSWFIQTWNPTGFGPWSNNAQPTNFTATIPSAPTAATLTYPAHGQNIGTDFTPIYTWDKVNNATYYRVYVGGSGGAVLDQWYQASAVCGASTCSINPSSTLGVGNYNWFIQTYGAGGYGPWSNNAQPTTFSTTATSAPGAVTLTYPAQGQNIGTDYTPTYQWNKLSTATWYRVYVSGPGGTVFDQWYQASVVCGASSCSITPTATLNGGTYSWLGQAWNPAGTGPWSNNAQPTNFTATVQSAPTGAVLTAPTGTIATLTPTFSWNKVSMATWYHLYIKGPYGVVKDQWYQGVNICNTTTCSVPGITLTAGDHAWWVQTYNAAGYGPWKNATFKISP